MASKFEIEFFQMFWGLIVLPLIFLSTAFFALDTSPREIKILSWFDPLTYGVDGLRGALTGYAAFPIWWNLTVLGVFTYTTVALALYLFREASP